MVSGVNIVWSLYSPEIEVGPYKQAPKPCGHLTLHMSLYSVYLWQLTSDEKAMLGIEDSQVLNVKLQFLTSNIQVPS